MSRCLTLLVLNRHSVVKPSLNGRTSKLGIAWSRSSGETKAVLSAQKERPKTVLKVETHRASLLNIHFSLVARKWENPSALVASTATDPTGTGFSTSSTWTAGWKFTSKATKTTGMLARNEKRWSMRFPSRISVKEDRRERGLEERSRLSFESRSIEAMQKSLLAVSDRCYRGDTVTLSGFRKLKENKSSSSNRRIDV
ncbi:hypothetical protein SELMODRAFT_416551 [Selaginella moellendorffii]|uniref:Uncharacterized protein n=1 Tax=Selaginella moellendorffii TaxID=88036 RepID=D8RZN0_SELML|nr:hypothetical protein SELMODRAFT_416551 [Selaginella moellendorffii]